MRSGRPGTAVATWSRSALLSSRRGRGGLGIRRVVRTVEAHVRARERIEVRAEKVEGRAAVVDPAVVRVDAHGRVLLPEDAPVQAAFADLHGERGFYSP